MFGRHFYHETFKRAIGAFGSLFNDIYIVRKNKSGGGVSTVKVPLSFAPKQKFIDEIRQRGTSGDLHDENVVAVTLPRMSFEHLGINYDPGRQLPKTNACIVAGSGSNRTKLYTKTPYNVQFALNIYVKTHEDALQIIEQIFPYFTPQYTLSWKPLDDYPTIIDDIPLTLNGVSYQDDYEGQIANRRTIIYTVDFDMKINLYGPTATGKVIEQADIDLFTNSIADSDIEVYVKATELSVTTDPRPVGPDSDFTYVETIRSVVEPGFDSDSG